MPSAMRRMSWCLSRTIRISFLRFRRSNRCPRRKLESSVPTWQWQRNSLGCPISLSLRQGAPGGLAAAEPGDHPRGEIDPQATEMGSRARLSAAAGPNLFLCLYLTITGEKGPGLRWAADQIALLPVPLWMLLQERFRIERRAVGPAEAAPHAHARHRRRS